MELFMDNKKKYFDIYSKLNNDKYRYDLGKNKFGKKCLFCIGVNPSTATSEKTDTTITKLENITYRKGKAKNIEFEEKFDSFIMLNIYPLRATNPKDLPEEIDFNSSKSVHNTNVAHILSLIDNNSTIWAAWGNTINSRHWLKKCLKEIISNIQKEKKDIKWVKMGNLTVENEPQHPSRVKYQKFTKYTKIKNIMNE